MMAPFVSAPDDYTETNPGAPSSPIVMEDAMGGMTMGDLGGASKPLIAIIVALLALKAAEEFGGGGGEGALSEIRITWLNGVKVVALFLIGKTGLTLLNAFLLKRGIVIPGVPDLIGAS